MIEPPEAQSKPMKPISRRRPVRRGAEAPAGRPATAVSDTVGCIAFPPVGLPVQRHSDGIGYALHAVRRGCGGPSQREKGISGEPVVRVETPTRKVAATWAGPASSLLIWLPRSQRGEVAGLGRRKAVRLAGGALADVPVHRLVQPHPVGGPSPGVMRSAFSAQTITFAQTFARASQSELILGDL